MIDCPSIININRLIDIDLFRFHFSPFPQKRLILRLRNTLPSLIYPKTYYNKNQVNYLSVCLFLVVLEGIRLPGWRLYLRSADSKKHNSFKRFTHDKNWGVVLSQLSNNHNLYSGAEERSRRISTS